MCVVWDVITTVVNAVINTIESVLGWVLSALAFIVQLIFSIPYIGRLLEWIWNVILTIVWGIVGVADAILGALGIRPEKKLRVCTLILDSDGGVRDEPSTIQSFVTALQNMITIYRREANVRIVDLSPFTYTSGFAGDETATADWVHIYKGNTPAGPLDTQCGASGAAEDLGTDGSAFELIASTQCFYGNFRRLIGYGAPVIIFGIRSIDPSTDNGCSLGPLSDYVTVLRTDPGSTPHEVGHACDLWHNDGATNLMNPNVDHVTTGIHLEWWQVIILRNSRHVTYF